MIEPDGQDKLTLSLDELLPDPGGDIVFEGMIDGLVVETDLNIVQSGISAAHVTAAGVDVTGYCFYELQGGVTLYSPTDLQLAHPPVG